MIPVGPGELLAAVATAAVGAFGWLAARTTAHRAARSAEIDRVNPSWSELVAEVRALRDDLSEETSRRRRVEDRLDRVEDDRDHLAEFARLMLAWEEDGRPDPPGAPRITVQARRVLDRLDHAGGEYRPRE